jgi:hypothetical protein
MMESLEHGRPEIESHTYILKEKAKLREGGARSARFLMFMILKRRVGAANGREAR